jgi:hypothetical protein
MDNLTEAKKIVRLEDIIPGDKKRKGRMIMVTKCPICNHYDHFVIYPEQNKFHSFAGCCAGGSALDWLIQYNNMDTKTAIKELLSMAGLEDTPASKNDLELRMRKREQDQKEQLRKEHVILCCFNKLTNLERTLRELILDLNSKDLLLNELLNFIEQYTMKFVWTSKHDTNELYHLCTGFKAELLKFCEYYETIKKGVK